MRIPCPGCGAEESRCREVLPACRKLAADQRRLYASANGSAVDESPALRSRVSELEAECDQLRAEVARLREQLRFATIEDRMIDDPFEPEPWAPNACMDWIEAHRAEMAQHVGRFVVIHGERGIIAVGDDPVALEREHGNTEGDVMVTFVSPILDAAPMGALDLGAPDPAEGLRGLAAREAGPR